MKQILLVICLLLPLRGLCTDPVEPTTTTLDISILFSIDSTSTFKTLVIPIKRVQNLIVIEARIDTLVGNFILDTGSPLLVLNKTYFRKGWNRDDRLAANATGGTTTAYQTSVKTLELRELYFEKIKADLTDLGHIENQRGIKILGLLGVSLFTSFEMIIDLHKSILYLHRLDEQGNVPESERAVKSTPIIKVPFDFTHNIITLDVIIAQKKLIFCLDTGAETNTLSNQLPQKILEVFQVSKRMVMLGTGGSRTEILLGTVDEITVGEKTFKNMHAAITRLESLGDVYGRSIDGILGNNFLVKGIISINFAKKEFCMYPFDVSKP